MAYLYETGWNVALVDLEPFVPQPRTDVPAQPIQRTDSASGTIHEMGLYIVLQWNVLPVALYQGILDQLGLDAAQTNQVTVYVPNGDFIFTRYNGMAVRPLPGRDFRRTRYFVHDVNLTIKGLTAL